MFADQLAALRSLVDETSSELSQSRLLPARQTNAANSSSFPSSSSTTSSTNATTTLTLRNSIINEETLTELRRDVEARSQRTRELIKYLESDLKAGKILSENTADTLTRMSSGMERLSDRIRTVEAKQQEILSALQERPMRNEIHSTIQATILPSNSYAKTRLNSLAESVSALEAFVDSHKGAGSEGGLSSEGEGGGGGGGVKGEQNGGASSQYLEERLERRLEDFLERKMRLRSRQIETDVVDAVKKSLDKKSERDATSTMVSEERGEGGASMHNCGGRCGDSGRDTGQNGENGGNGTRNTFPGNSAAYVSAKDLEVVQEKFSKEVRLVQNSLVSLRTQLRMLGRDVKAIKIK